MAGAEKAGEREAQQKTEGLTELQSRGLRRQGRPVSSSPRVRPENKTHASVRKAGEVKKAPESRDLSDCRAFLCASLLPALGLSVKQDC